VSRVREIIEKYWFEYSKSKLVHLQYRDCLIVVCHVPVDAVHPILLFTSNTASDAHSVLQAPVCCCGVMSQTTN
jgi:hypothetical protein